jgi:hypothetical protein
MYSIELLPKVSRTVHSLSSGGMLIIIIIIIIIYHVYTKALQFYT